MSKYIDASLVVEVHVYDDEHEEWGMWSVTIEELLNRWTEGGCPPTIEVGEDCIGRADLIESFLADNECKREEAKACMCSLDFMLELIEDAPPVIPTVSEDCISRKWLEENAKEFSGYYQGAVYAVPLSMLDNAPSVTPTERTGEWIKHDHRLLESQRACSLCGESTMVKYRYCPNCGAKMKGGTENE